MTLNPQQRIARKAYADGVHKDLETYDKVGDTLYTFIMIELSTSEDCNSVPEAINRIDNAINDLIDVLTALENHQET